MGLKDKALKFTQNINLNKTDAKKSENIQPLADNLSNLSEPEEILAQKKLNKGEKQKVIPDKTLTSDPFLSSEDIHSTTRPVMHGLAQQMQIESLLSLIELCKGLSTAHSEFEFFDTILFTLMGQLGIKEIAIFLKEAQNFSLRANKGFAIQAGFQIPLDSSLLKALSQENGLIYTEQLIPNLHPLEKTWFCALNTDFLIPITNSNDGIVGFIILGHTIAKMEYNLEDLIYLKLLGELLGSFYHSIQQLIKQSEKKKYLDDQKSNYKTFNRYVRMIQKATNFEQIKQIFIESITYDYKINKFVFLLKQGKQFLPNLYKNLDEKTIKKIITSSREPWIIEMKNQTGWYEYTDLLEDIKFTKKFSAEDFSIINKIFILPIYFSNEIEGIFIVFNIHKEINLTSLNSLSAIINSYYWAFLAYKNKLDTVTSLEDPLFDLRNLIANYENDLQIKQIPYSIIYITIENIIRLKKLINNYFLNKQRMYVKKTLHSMISEQDYCLEIFPAKFLIVLRGKSNKVSEHLFIKLVEAINLKYKLERTRPIIKCKTLNRPHQKAISIDSFLFD